MARTRPRSHPKPQGKTDKFVTQQQFRDDANINTMLGRHMKGPGRMGLPIGNPNATRQPRFEYQPSESFHEMLNLVTDAQNAFRALPARTRGRFSNDPYQLLRFLENPENREEAIKLGLVDPAHKSLSEEVAEALRASNLVSGHLDPDNLEEGSETLPDPESQPRFKGGKKS